jgi:leader peptidase (prepilin peptidase) / N-methyltransferase
MDVLVTGLAAAGGLVIGDGLEVVVERLGAHESLERPWWRCPSCQEPLTGVAVVPLAGVMARARPCAHCGARRSRPWRSAVMAVVSAVVLGAFAVRIGPHLALLPYCILGLSLVAISAVDFERFIIPNRIVYPTLAVLVPLLVVTSAADHSWGLLTHAAIAGAAAFLAFYVVHLVVPGGMGFGDVRLAGVLGVAVGWIGLGLAFVAFFIGFLLGAVIGIVVMMVTGGGRKTKVPFGPFLAAGAIIAIVWGNPIVNALFHRSVS